MEKGRRGRVRDVRVVGCAFVCVFVCVCVGVLGCSSDKFEDTKNEKLSKYLD